MRPPRLLYPRAGWFVWRCKQSATLTAIRSFCPDRCQPLVLQRSTSAAFGKAISSSGEIMVLTADSFQLACECCLRLLWSRVTCMFIAPRAPQGDRQSTVDVAPAKPHPLGFRLWMSSSYIQYTSKSVHRREEAQYVRATLRACDSSS